MSLVLCSVALSGFALPNFALPNGENADVDEVTIRVTAANGSTTASFDVFFRTENDTLISEQSVVAPKTFKLEANQFTGYIRPLGGAKVKVEKAHGGLRSSSSSSRPVRITRNGDDISSTFVDPEDLE